MYGFSLISDRPAAGTAPITPNAVHLSASISARKLVKRPVILMVVCKGGKFGLPDEYQKEIIRVVMLGITFS
jgi:hypothetical protein